MKNGIKRLLLNAVAILIIISLLASCRGKNQTNSSSIDEIDYFAYPFTEEAGAIKICGVDLENYRIVIPEICDLYTRYAAQNLDDFLIQNAGVDLDIVTDAESATDYELIVGETNRIGSITAAKTELLNSQYIVMMDGYSVILYGKSYMVGGAASDFVNNYAAGAWRGFDIDITDIPTTPTAKEFVFKEAKNAILLIGDGMGWGSIEMASAEELGKFAATDMPFVGELITQSQSVINGDTAATDSAAGGTALATGYKTLNRYLGLGPNKNTLINVRELAHSLGAKTSILTTDSITGATPASFLVHVEDRDYTEAIEQTIEQMLKAGEVNYAIGSLDDNLLDTSAAVLHASASKGSRFFSMIEEAYIDKYAHNRDTAGVVLAVKRFNRLIAYCMEFVLFYPDTALIVTADHETGGITKTSSVKYTATTGSHTNINVPVFAMGIGTDRFNNTVSDNTSVAKFIAAIYGNKEFGDTNIQ